MIIEAHDAIPLIIAGNARAIDATYVLPNSDARCLYRIPCRAYPGGRCILILTSSPIPPRPLPHTMPSADTFTAMVQILGIKQGEALICYDQSGFFIGVGGVWVDVPLFRA